MKKPHNWTVNQNMILNLNTKFKLENISSFFDKFSIYTVLFPTKAPMAVEFHEHGGIAHDME